MNGQKNSSEPPVKKSRSTGGKKQAKLGWLPRVRQWLIRLLLKTIMYATLLASLVTAGYLYYLDRSISKTFEGRLWSVPAQVYAQPLELFAGKRLTLSLIHI